MSGIELVIDNMKTELNDLKQQISEARKSGATLTIVDLKIMSIPAKIGIAEATKEFKDVKKIKEMLTEVKKELEESLDESKRHASISISESNEKIHSLVERSHTALKKKRC